MYDERLRDAHYDIAGREGVLAVAGRHGPFGNRRGDVRGVRGDELVRLGFVGFLGKGLCLEGASAAWRAARTESRLAGLLDKIASVLLPLVKIFALDLAPFSG